MSFPKASIIRAISSRKPIICATIRNFSPGFFPVIISYMVNSMCPPSSPGIGSRFITPSIMDSMARR